MTPSAARDPAPRRTPALRRPGLVGLLALVVFAVACARRGLAPADSSQIASFDYAWTRVRDTYPDPAMRGVDWDAVREELRPQAARARDAAALRPILEDMFSRLGDSHFAVIPQSLGARVERPSARDAIGGNGGPGSGEVGLDVRLLQGEVVVTRADAGGPAELAGLRTGDALIGIGAVDVPALVAEVSAESRDPRGLGLLVQRLVLAAFGGWPGAPLPVRWRDGAGAERAGAVVPVASDAPWVQLGSLPPVPVHVRHEIIRNYPDHPLGYVAFDAFLGTVPERFAAAMAELRQAAVRGVVLDLRGNSGGVAPMAMGLAGYFVDQPGLSLGRLSYRDMPLELVVNPRPAEQRIDAPLAVLVDELSVSSAEIMAAGLQKIGRARVFGVPSAGMALPSTWERLPNGDLIQYVTADFTDPSGARLEGVGVQPDVALPLTREALIRGEDPALDAAIDWLTPTK